MSEPDDELAAFARRKTAMADATLTHQFVPIPVTLQDTLEQAEASAYVDLTLTIVGLDTRLWPMAQRLIREMLLALYRVPLPVVEVDKRIVATLTPHLRRDTPWRVKQD